MNELKKQSALQCFSSLPLEQIRDAIAQAKSGQLSEDDISTLWDACDTAVAALIKVKSILVEEENI